MLQLLIGIMLLPILLYLPGWVWSRAIFTPTDTLSRHYERAVVSALWLGWLALVLAELGLLKLWLVLLLTGGGCAAGWALAHTRVRRQRVQPSANQNLSSAEPRPRWEIPLYGLVLLIFALMIGRPFETTLGGRDAGVYANTGYAIARTGSIVQTEPLVAEIARNRVSADPTIKLAAEQAYTNLLGNQNRKRFISTRYTQPGFFTTETAALRGRVYPAGFHLYPVWIALWTLLFGLHGGLIATGYLGLLGLWSVAMAGRRLVQGRAGTYVGGFTLVFLAFNTLQIWFSRYTTAEAGTQMLLWAGLAMWASFASLAADARRTATGIWYGALTGSAIGQLILVRLDFFWGVGPLLAYLIVVLVRRRWTRGHGAMAIGLGLMLGHGFINLSTLARAYFFDNAFARLQDYAIVARLTIYFYPPVLQNILATNPRSGPYNSTLRLLLELAIVVGLGLALWGLWRWPRMLHRLETLLQRWRQPLSGGLAIVVLLVAAYAYFIRPQALGIDALLHPLEQQARWQSYIGAPLPIPPDAPYKQVQRTIVLGNMVRLGWYFSPLGIVLGVIGLAGWIWRDLNRRSWLVLSIGLAYAAFYIRDTYGTAEQTYIYIARRFIPGAVPIFTLGIAWLLAMLITAQRRIWRVAAGFGGVALLVFFVATGWRSVRHSEYAGAIDAIAQLANRIEPNAIVLMRGGDRDTPTNIATPLRYAFGREVLVAYSPNPLAYRTQLAQQIRLWQAASRPVYLLLGSNGGVLNFPGFELIDRGLFDLKLPEWQQLQLQKPYTAGEVRFIYRLYQLQPTTPTATSSVPLALTDYRWQVSGLYPTERDRVNGALSQPYAWTAGAATLVLPPTTHTATLELQLGLGTLPPSLQRQPVDVCPTLEPLDARLVAPSLPCATITSTTPTTVAWTLPPLPADSWLFTFPSRTWSPNTYRAEYPTPPNDGRTLGIQWGGGRIITTP